MARILIEHDGQPLTGAVHVDGGKHAFAHSLACAALADCGRLTGVPDHVDARALRAALALGFNRVEYAGERRVLTFAEPVRVPRITLTSALASRSRSLYCLLPALLLRADEVVIEAAPSGCQIGDRPTDWYLKALAAFGVRARGDGRTSVLSWPVRRAAEVTFGYPTMTGTAIALAAAAVAPGRSAVWNASVEPSIAEQLACLRSMGGRVDGDLPAVRVAGGRYPAVDWAVAPDRIHAVTYLTAGLLTRGTVTVTGSAPLRIPRFVEFLRQAGVRVDDSGAAVTAGFPAAGALRPVSVESGSEPLFSSDWVTFAALLLATRGGGRSTISDDVFPGRFQYVDNLKPHGLTGVLPHPVKRRGRAAVYVEIKPSPAPLRSGDFGRCADIRGSAALVLAGLVADGPCTVADDFHLRRGYTDLPGDLTALGGEHVLVRTEGDSA